MTAGPVARLARWPDAAAALAWPGGELSYGELRARVAALAGLAAGRGAPGTPLAVITPSRVDLVLGTLAALWLGRPALPLDPSRGDIDACLAACEPGGFLEPADFAQAVAGRLARVEGGAFLPPGEAAVAPDRPALLVPTSGTGGTTRVAMLPAAALDAHVVASMAALPSLGPADRWLVCLPANTIGALAASWRTLTAGACLALLERFDATEARGLMAAGASHVSVVPAMLDALADAPGPPPRGLRCLLSGGGPLSQRAADSARARDWPLWQGWGMTETCAHVAVGRVDETWHEGVIGPPVTGAQLTVDPGHSRLTIGGPMLMSGYARPGLAPGAGLTPDGRFASADVGELLDDGRLRILGRADDIIVTGGVNVAPGPVEDVLARCPGAGEVAVTGQPDPRWGMSLVALYTGPAPAAAIEAWARAQLASEQRPRRFLHVGALPRNAMGKLLRGELGRLLPRE
ncbi:AMP-binding protein [Wenzhouxiangella sp. XN24]|uniref:class I adenylate-forming enzyme family protein n=1 Tax=Wenzhouxiangella sp. XN24 TaxID=2713569 RepID=UPI0013EC014B|nr:AMP-binding protein [Wenzhouxiangella sp. XN24]NGX16896.1 AMP-binding protein [Wenzhouxiangella sp. XN24]